MIVDHHSAVSSCQFLLGVHHGDLEIRTLFLTPGEELQDRSVQYGNELPWKNQGLRKDKK